MFQGSLHVSRFRRGIEMESIWTELLDNQLLWRTSTFFERGNTQNLLKLSSWWRGPCLCSCNDSVNKHLGLLCAPTVFISMCREVPGQLWELESLDWNYYNLLTVHMVNDCDAWYLFQLSIASQQITVKPSDLRGPSLFFHNSWGRV